MTALAFRELEAMGTCLEVRSLIHQTALDWFTMDAVVALAKLLATKEISKIQLMSLHTTCFSIVRSLHAIRNAVFTSTIARIVTQTEFA
jgi:hypothetical protein